MYTLYKALQDVIAHAHALYEVLQETVQIPSG